MLILFILFIFYIIFNSKNILLPFSLYVLSWLLYIGIKYSYNLYNFDQYNDDFLNLIIISTVSFIFGYFIFSVLFYKKNNLSYNYNIPKPSVINSNVTSVNEGDKLLISSAFLVFFFTIYLVSLGINIFEIFNDSLAVRWVLGNGGNNLITQFFLVPLSVIPVILIWKLKNVNKYKAILIFFLCFFYFYLLGIRGVIVDWFFSYMAINSFKNKNFSLPLKKIFYFGFIAGLIMTIIGFIRLNNQLDEKIEYKSLDKLEIINLSTQIFFERLDFLDVLNAYFVKEANGNNELKLPLVPVFSNFIPRNFVSEKIYPTDTQVTKIAGEGFAQENITRIVGPLPELYKLGGPFLIIVWFFLFGFLFNFLSIKIFFAKNGSTLQILYSKQLLQIGSLPLFFGINTIFGTQFIIVSIISIITIKLLK
jgi:oligosaccharide repeat unit polymerase